MFNNIQDLILEQLNLKATSFLELCVILDCKPSQLTKALTSLDNHNKIIFNSKTEEISLMDRDTERKRLRNRIDVRDLITGCNQILKPISDKFFIIIMDLNNDIKISLQTSERLNFSERQIIATIGKDGSNYDQGVIAMQQVLVDELINSTEKR